MSTERLYHSLRGHPALAGVFTLIALALIAGVVLFVDLKPHVEQEFFFSSGDPSMRMDEQVGRLFPGGSQIVLSVAGDLSSSAYLAAVGRLSNDLARLPDVDGVQSMARGPKNAKHALESPLWKRLVIGEDAKSSLVLVSLKASAESAAIVQIEQIADKHHGPAVEIRISGVAYVVEQIRRSLWRDMLVFGSLAIVVFGLIVSILFRSPTILLGTMVSCLSASCLTLIGASLLDLKIGVLTANLVTIVFVMTLHHIIYLTFGWKEATERGLTGPEAVQAAVQAMLRPSWWVMTTTFLGFASLLFGRAQPLRELGLSGALGALIGFLVAYLVHPSFLRLARAPATRRAGVVVGDGRPESPIRAVFARRYGWAVAGVLVAAAFLATGALKLNKDPSLLSYFRQGSEVRAGLEQVDRNGGSSPLRLVVGDASGDRLDSKKAYHRLWALQNDLEAHPAAGAVLSPALLMAEAKDSTFGWLLSHRFLLKKLEDPKYGSATNAFFTKDRRKALFVLRMKESPERHDRLQTVEEIRQIVRARGFEVEMVGGLYALQGQVSELVVSSLVTGVGQLLLSFLVVAALVSRSLRWCAALMLSLCLVPGILLGAFGYAGMALDIICAPAINIALGMAIDDMIHMTEAARALRRKGASAWAAWSQARAHSFKALVGTATVTCAGFAILLFSSFPPTQRFGLAVLGGALIDVLVCLLVLPYLAGAGRLFRHDLPRACAAH